MVLAFTKRCREVNPLINAIMENRFDNALVDAKKVDAYLNKNELTISELKLRKPLLGIPLTVKEACQVKGKLL